MALIDRLLRVAALLFEFARLVAQALQFGFLLFQQRRVIGQRGLQSADFPLARQHALFAAPIQAQPVASAQDALRRHRDFALPQRRAPRQRGFHGGGGSHPGQQAGERPRRAHLARQRRWIRRGVRSRGRRWLDQGQSAPGDFAGGAPRGLVEARHADRVQHIGQDGFHRSFPARLHLQLLRQAPRIRQPLAVQPVLQFLLMPVQRRFLQGL